MNLPLYLHPLSEVGVCSFVTVFCVLRIKKNKMFFSCGYQNKHYICSRFQRGRSSLKRCCFYWLFFEEKGTLKETLNFFSVLLAGNEKSFTFAPANTENVFWD